MYIYPDHLRAKATLWLWQLRDVGIIGVMALINLIRYPQRGVCLYKCGNERYNLMVSAPEHKAKLFGKAGGR